MIRIRSLIEGFRRAGVAHSTTPTDHPDTQFTADELEQLLHEPMLAVEVLTDNEESADEGGDKVGSDDEVKSAPKGEDKPDSDPKVKPANTAKKAAA